MLTIRGKLHYGLNRSGLNLCYAMNPRSANPWTPSLILIPHCVLCCWQTSICLSLICWMYCGSGCSRVHLILISTWHSLTANRSCFDYSGLNWMAF